MRLLLCLCGCLDMLVAPQSQHAPSKIHAPIIAADAFVTLKNAADAHSDLCTADADHPNFPDDEDLLTRVFCQDVVPTPHGLADLLKLLNLDFKDPAGENG